MKRLLIPSIGDSEKKTMGQIFLAKDDTIPEFGPKELLVKVAYNGICGSDGHLLRGNIGPLRPVVLGLIEAMGAIPVGHEFSGVVEEVGEKAAALGFKKGDRIACNYYVGCGSCYWCRTGRENFCQNTDNRSMAMADYIVVDSSQAYKIPDQLSLKTAAMAEPFTIAFNAVEVAKVKMGSRVAVFGGGGIGQMIAQLAKVSGAAYVAMIEPVEEKRKLALELGADYAIDPIKEDVKKITEEITGGLGFDCVIEASGASVAAIQALDILSIDGNVVYFSMYNTEFNMPINLFTQLYQQQKHIHGMQTSAGIWPRAIAAMSRIQIDPLIQKVYTLDEYEQAFADHFTGAYAKVMFHCNPDIE